MDYLIPKSNLNIFTSTLPNRPGVYQFFDENHVILYVGKARDIKKRVSSYFSRQQVHPKITRMIAQATYLQTIITSSETEALILESNLIKEHHPRYNVLLRDDKSYPYISLTRHDDFPRMDFYRGRARKDLKLFGPFPSTTAVRASLNLLQKIFKGMISWI